MVVTPRPHELVIGCTKRNGMPKVGYPLRPLAKAAARRLKVTGQTPEWRRITVYQCKSCGLWHVGRTNKDYPVEEQEGK